MKKKITNSILTALVFVLLMPLYGQKHTYIPMAVEGAHWWVSLWNTQFPPWAPADVYQYVVRGDSIVNDINYKKVYYRDLQDESPWNILSEYLIALIRDDEPNQEVYFVWLSNYYIPFDCPLNEDVLLYSFSVQTGDTLDWCLLVGYWGEKAVYSVTYETYYGQERKIINFEDQFSHCIEGIGSNYGVFEFGYGSKGWYYELGNYCVGTDEECGCQWVGINEKQKANPFRVYPNPVTGSIITLILDHPVSEPVEVRLYDMTGREIYRQVFERISEKLTLQIPDFRSAPSSTLLLWVGNSQSTLHKQLVIRK